MDLRKLEVFCKLVELGSFTKTADAVLLSQPTVSEHIRNLEEELGHKLVDRLGRDVQPTPLGELLYGYARKILQTRQEALQAVEQFSGKLVGRIMLGCGTIPGTYIFPRLIGEFRKKNPAIKATLRISGSRLIADEVKSGALDLGVVGAKWNDSDLSWTQIYNDNLSLVVNSRHRWAGKKEVSPEMLLDEPFILREVASGTRKAFDQILHGAGYKVAQLKEVAEMGSTSAVKEAIKAGLGVSILSDMAVAEEVAYGLLAKVRLKDITMERPFYLISRKNRELSPVASVFLNYLNKWVAEEQVG